MIRQKKQAMFGLQTILRMKNVKHGKTVLICFKLRKVDNLQSDSTQVITQTHNCHSAIVTARVCKQKAAEVTFCCQIDPIVHTYLLSPCELLCKKEKKYFCQFASACQTIKIYIAQLFPPRNEGMYGISIQTKYLGMYLVQKIYYQHDLG